MFNFEMKHKTKSFIRCQVVFLKISLMYKTEMERNHNYYD